MAKIKQLKFIKNSNYFKITKEEFNTLLSNQVLKKSVQFIFFLQSGSFLSLALLWIKIPPQLPLFYNKPWGEEQLVNKSEFFLLPLSCLIFTIINIRLASFFFRKELLISQVLVYTTITINILSTISLVKILINIL